MKSIQHNDTKTRNVSIISMAVRSDLSACIAESTNLDGRQQFWYVWHRLHDLATQQQHSRHERQKDSLMDDLCVGIPLGVIGVAGSLVGAFVAVEVACADG